MGDRRGIDLLYDVRDAKAGDRAAAARLQAASKGMTGGASLSPRTDPVYVEARQATNLLRTRACSALLTRK